MDAGDWFSGSLFHLLGPSEQSSFAPELEAMDYCTFDAATIGACAQTEPRHRPILMIRDVGRNLAAKCRPQSRCC